MDLGPPPQPQEKTQTRAQEVLGLTERSEAGPPTNHPLLHEHHPRHSPSVGSALPSAQPPSGAHLLDGPCCSYGVIGSSCVEEQLYDLLQLVSCSPSSKTMTTLSNRNKYLSGSTARTRQLSQLGSGSRDSHGRQEGGRAVPSLTLAILTLSQAAAAQRHPPGSPPRP